MGPLLGFAPFFDFVASERLVSVPAGLAGGASISALLPVRDALSGARRKKVLEVGTFVLFSGRTLPTLPGR